MSDILKLASCITVPMALYVHIYVERVLYAGSRGLHFQKAYPRPGFIGASSDESSRTLDRMKRDFKERHQSSG